MKVEERTPLLVRCPACGGRGKVTLREKAERRDGTADHLRPEAGVYWHVTYHPDGSVEEHRRPHVQR